MASNENLPPNVIKQLAKELKNLDETPPEGIKVGVNDDNFSVINADIDGPAGTPCLLIEPFPESALNEQAGKMLLENYDEYARHARLYTGIHALKPKPKSRTGANVDQTNSSTKGVNQKNGVSSAASPLAPKPGNGQDVPSVLGVPSTKSGAGESATDAAAALLTQKKESGLHKVQATDKKKMDARKKSLKRL